MAAATTGSPKVSPHPGEGLVGGDDDRGPFVAGGDQLEEEVGGFGFEGDVSDLVDHEQRDPPEAGELCLQPSCRMGFAEPGDPFGGGGESDPMAGLAGSDPQGGGEVGFPGPGWAEEDHVVFAGDEVEGSEVGDDVSFEAALMVEVEIFDGFAGGEACSFDPVLTAVVLTGSHLPFQTGRKELFMGPTFGSGPFRQSLHRGCQRRSFEGPAEPGEVGGGTADGFLGGHQATPVSRS